MPQEILTLTYHDAKSLMNAAVSSANQHQVPGAIAIVDHGGHLMMLERMDNTMCAAANIAIGKASTSLAFQRPTSDIEDVISNGRGVMTTLNSSTPHPYVPLLGGHPVTINDQIVGAIAVAGTMDAKMDDVVAKEALRVFQACQVTHD